jgi:hypothetical protein
VPPPWWCIGSRDRPIVEAGGSLTAARASPSPRRDPLDPEHAKREIGIGTRRGPCTRDFDAAHAEMRCVFPPRKGRPICRQWLWRKVLTSALERTVQFSICLGLKTLEIGFRGDMVELANRMAYP